MEQTVKLSKITENKIEASGTISITNNGIYDVKDYATADVNINIPETTSGLADQLITRSVTTISSADLSNITEIGNYAFAGCDKLTSIEIPENITNIGNDAFSYCSSLISIIIPDGVTRIENDVFFYCTSLENIVIPSNITSISSGAFYNCTGLTTITFKGTVSQWREISKGSNWNLNVPATYVQCSDGQVQLT